MKISVVSALLKVGAVIAEKYRVERLIAEGGMGVVVAARHLQLDETVALKLMAVRGDGAVAGRRFTLEARALAKLRSEHVARINDSGVTADGTPYIVMEYLEGIDLARLLAEHGPLPVSDAVDYLLQACLAMAEAHSLHIVHRDLKPANLFLTRRIDGSPLLKVLDFGISKVDAAGQDPVITQEASGETLGSPGYMSPEQLRAVSDVDQRTDIWSLGAILFELLTGMRPFMAEQMPEIYAKILYESPLPLRERAPWVSPGLEA
ncbi:MAG: serine/threonine-protein kinase, partial [Myxococcota bacterium]